MRRRPAIHSFCKHTHTHKGIFTIYHNKTHVQKLNTKLHKLDFLQLLTCLPAQVKRTHKQVSRTHRSLDLTEAHFYCKCVGSWDKNQIETSVMTPKSNRTSFFNKLNQFLILIGVKLRSVPLRWRVLFAWVLGWWNDKIIHVSSYDDYIIHSYHVCHHHEFFNKPPANCRKWHKDVQN